MYFKFISSAILLHIVRHASAANVYSDNDLQTNLSYVAQDVAPIWHFTDGSCYPQAASVNGQQTNGNNADSCIIKNLASGCQDPGPWQGPNTRGTPFPTYYTTSTCSDGRFVICYDIYFRHDSGHESDWEWACVNLKKDGNNMWYRDSIILEQDPVRRFVNWGDLISWSEGQDLNDDSLRNNNHAKVYSAKFHHTMFPNQQDNTFKNECASDVADMYRNNDFLWLAADNLVDGNTIPISWVWGKAASNPQALAKAVCGY